jgi:hypothetical protein
MWDWRTMSPWLRRKKHEAAEFALSPPPACDLRLRGLGNVSKVQAMRVPCLPACLPASRPPPLHQSTPPSLFLSVHARVHGNTLVLSGMPVGVRVV